MRIVKTKSIPNVPTERLVDDVARLHEMIHTIDGLHRWEDTRRGLINHGIKVRKITAELRARGELHQVQPCRFCIAED